MRNRHTKTELFESVPVFRALATMAIPTIISQVVNLIYNMVDAFFIGRTGNSYMMAATTITLTLMMLSVAFSNLFGVGGGSLIARLMGQKRTGDARAAASFSVYGCIAIALCYSLVIGLFSDPVLKFLGASDETLGFAGQYTLYVIVLGALPTILSLTLAHLLRNTGHSAQASIGLSAGGILNMLLDPFFMFVLLPKGEEVAGAAIATLISNTCGCIYLVFAYRRASKTAPLSLNPKRASALKKVEIRELFGVGVPSALLTALFDLANIVLNILSAAHSDLVLAAMGIVMKIERLPNAINLGICQGMLPIVAYNYSSGNRDRMGDTIRTARRSGLIVSAVSIVLLEIFAYPATNLFLDTSLENRELALVTVGFAALFLRIRCIASPVQFLNYHSSFGMQAMGKGKQTLLHALVREIVFYIPCMFIFDKLFSEIGLAAALPVGEGLGAVFAIFLLTQILKKQQKAVA